MLMLLPIVVALAATEPVPAASTAPTTSSAPTPLKEIGRVRALPACVPIVAHANGAISQALDNDRTLAIMTNNLHATDFDKLNMLQRRNAIEALMKQAEAMRVASSAGDVEVKKLREYAVNSPDPQRKAELKAFADALGGAIQRQMRAVEEFDKAVVVMEGREAALEARGLSTQRGDAVLHSYQPPSYATDADAPKWNGAMQDIAADLDSRELSVLKDEGVAADHSIAATTGC